MTDGRNRRRRRGFTAVEALVALGIGTLVLGILIALLRQVSVAFGSSEDRLDPRERALITFTELRSQLEDAWSYRIGAGGQFVVFATPHGRGEIAFDGRGKLLLMRAGELRPTALIAAGVKAFAVLPQAPGFVRLVLEIARPPGREQAFGRHARLVTEIFMPAASRGGRDIPWNPALEPWPQRHNS